MLSVDEARVIVAARTGRSVLHRGVSEDADYFHFGPEVHGEEFVPGGLVAVGDPSYLVDKRTGELVTIHSADGDEWIDRLHDPRPVPRA